MWWNIPKLIYIGCMKKLDKRLLDSQIEVYLEWTRRKGGVGGAKAQWLELFSLHSMKTDIIDVTEDDIEDFRSRLSDYGINPVWHADAIKHLRRMIRFYAARVKNGKQKAAAGRPPLIGLIALAQDYRKKGLKLREIAKLLDRPLPLVHRWINYPLNRGEEA